VPRTPLLRILLPFALGIWLADVSEPTPTVAASAALLALLALVWARGRRSRIVLELLLGTALGALALATRLHAPLPSLAEAPASWTVLEPPRARGPLCRLLVRIHGERSGRARLHAPIEACALLPGQHAVARLDLEPLRPPSNPGARDLRRQWRRRGVRVAARLVGGLWLPAEPVPWSPRSGLERIRRRAGAAVDPAELSGRAGPVLRALVTGERAALNPQVRDSFTRSGTAHLLAVSGLHVGWVFALTHLSVGWVLRRSSSPMLLRGATRVALGVGVIAACLYAGVAGLGVPALRATAMAFAGTLAVWGGRRAASLNALALAALAVLALDPASLFDAAFALSFSAVLGILLWGSPGGRLLPLLHATLGATLATAPWIAALGGPLPVGTVVANLLAVPFFGIVVVPLGLLNAMVGPSLAPGAQLVTELGIRGVELLSSPDLLAGAREPVWLSLAICCAGFSLRMLARARRTAAWSLAFAAVVAGAVAWAAPESGAARRSPWALFLDVGHGDATLLRGSDGAWLVDAGPRFGPFDAGRSTVVPALRAEGVTRLRGLIITHVDRDHAGGAGSVLRALPVAELWLSLDTWLDPGSAELRLEAARRGTRLRVVAAGDRAGLGGLDLRVLWPERGARFADANEGSIVLRVEGEGHCALLPGDVPVRVERHLLADSPPCELLKLGHHGSLSSSDPAWLDRLAPWVAVSSAGRRSGAQLPHPRVRERLAGRRVSLYETWRHGAVRVELSAAGLAVHPWLNPPWQLVPRDARTTAARDR
jgi:competence protein ComEC